VDDNVVARELQTEDTIQQKIMQAKQAKESGPIEESDGEESMASNNEESYPKFQDAAIALEMVQKYQLWPKLTLPKTIYLMLNIS